VKLSVYNHLNNDIGKEVKSHLNEIEIKKQCYFPYSLGRMERKRYNTVDVNLYSILDKGKFNLPI
jgi:hypothetical protein